MIIWYGLPNDNDLCERKSLALWDQAKTQAHDSLYPPSKLESMKEMFGTSLETQLL